MIVDDDCVKIVLSKLKKKEKKEKKKRGEKGRGGGKSFIPSTSGKASLVIGKVGLCPPAASLCEFGLTPNIHCMMSDF